jgi:hypothetical protein
MSSPRLLPVLVDSSLLTSVAYDAGASILRLEFHSGAVYRYFDVPQSVHDDLMQAESKGSYFNDSIRGCFAYTLERPSR